MYRKPRERSASGPTGNILRSRFEEEMRRGKRRREDAGGKEWRRTMQVRAGRGDTSVDWMQVVIQTGFSRRSTRESSVFRVLNSDKKKSAKLPGERRSSSDHLRIASAATLTRQKNITRKTFANNGQLPGIVTANSAFCRLFVLFFESSFVWRLDASDFVHSVFFYKYWVAWLLQLLKIYDFVFN